MMTNQPEAMATARGCRIVARPASAGVVVTVMGLQVILTPDESHQLRDLLQAAELAHGRGAYFDEL